MITLLLSIALAAPPPALQAVLDRGETSLSSVPRGLRPVVLSNLAGGCAREGDAACVKRAADLALAIAPWTQERFGDHGLYNTHLAITLDYAVAMGFTEERPLRDRLVAHLIATSTADPWHNPPSYHGAAQRWPADQAATLYAIYLADPSAARQLLTSWRQELHTRGTDPLTGLPVSELTGTVGYAKHPRGCALFWTIAYLAPLDPVGARALFDASAALLAVQTPFGLAMREYPEGRDLPEDDDSGPIIAGIGTASTAFARAAANAVLAQRELDALARNDAAVVSVLAWTGPDELIAASSGPMPASIRYRWYARR